MKKNFLTKTVAAIILTGILILSPNTAAMAATEAAAPVIERTKAWDAIEYTLGGIPESVIKIEYAGSVFYLGTDVTEADFLAVLDVGSEAVRMKPPQENGKLYNYPVYILWNADKTVLLVHPIVISFDDVLEAVAIPANPPESLLNGDKPEQESADASLLPMKEADIKTTPIKGLTKVQTLEYMLSAEYADAVRAEFYRLINEHRAANGLRELEVDLELQDYADIRAEEQSIRSGHTRPDGSAAGSGWHGSRNTMDGRYAENTVGAGVLGTDPKKTANSIFTCWKESKGHNRHMLYDFKSEITMGFGIVPKLNESGRVVSGAIFASGY